MGMFEFFKKTDEKVSEKKKPVEKKPVILNPNLERYQYPKVTFTEDEVARMKEEKGMTDEEIAKKGKLAENSILFAKEEEVQKRLSQARAKIAGQN